MRGVTAGSTGGSAESESASLFGDLFTIVEFATIDIPGRFALRRAIYAFMSGTA